MVYLGITQFITFNFVTRLKRNQIANACKEGLCALSPFKRDWINDVHYNYDALLEIYSLYLMHYTKHPSGQKQTFF